MYRADRKQEVLVQQTMAALGCSKVALASHPIDGYRIRSRSRQQRVQPGLAKEWQELHRKSTKLELSLEEKEKQTSLRDEYLAAYAQYIRGRIHVYHIEDNLPHGAWRLGYFSHKYRWNEHMKVPGLVLLCERTEGCCARGCGCCSKPRGPLVHPAHCTVECQCCRDSRRFRRPGDTTGSRFDWTEEELKIIKPDFAPHGCSDPRYALISHLGQKTVCVSRSMLGQSSLCLALIELWIEGINMSIKKTSSNE